MPAAVTEPEESDKDDKTKQMWKALKSHILRERNRKKQEREAEVEEERLRKEREAREQQDVMTLGETRDQISQLEVKLQKLKEEKHQLFLQLKKVLNEDDNRRRQLVKESNEALALQSLSQGLVHQPLYISSNNIPRTTIIPQPQTFNAGMKRPRSQSPPSVVPVSQYHQNYGYKPPPPPPPPVPAPSYPTPQKDDSRRHELVRAVLWNKTPQYTTQPTAFYAVPPQELPMYYPMGAIPPREPVRAIYEPPRPQTFHMEPKIPEHYTLRAPASHTHVIHGATIPLNPSQPPNKAPPTGSITTGYPVRAPQQYQPPPGPQTALYTGPSRALYQPPSASMSYPPRD